MPRLSPRRQGDLGELSAMEWLGAHGYDVYFPIGHSPDCDLVADDGEKLERVQVKTSTQWRHRRWEVTLCTRGGNQSWNGLVKRFSSSRCDWLFVARRRRTALVRSCRHGRGRNEDRSGWSQVRGIRGRARATADPGANLIAILGSPLAGFPSGQRGCAVNALALPSQVRILPPPYPYSASAARGLVPSARS